MYKPDSDRTVHHLLAGLFWSLVGPASRERHLRFAVAQELAEVLDAVWVLLHGLDVFHQPVRKLSAEVGQLPLVDAYVAARTARRARRDT
jgi:hypothetical protein